MYSSRILKGLSYSHEPRALSNQNGSQLIAHGSRQKNNTL